MDFTSIEVIAIFERVHRIHVEIGSIFDTSEGFGLMFLKFRIEFIE